MQPNNNTTGSVLCVFRLVPLQAGIEFAFPFPGGSEEFRTAGAVCSGLLVGKDLHALNPFAARQQKIVLEVSPDPLAAESFHKWNFFAARQQKIGRGGCIMNDNWGLCRACRWWQIEPDAAINEKTIGRCVEEHLVELQLSVMGHCGCSHFVEGRPLRVEGSSEQPPRLPAPQDRLHHLSGKPRGSRRW
jgi:hypothetical protein